MKDFKLIAKTFSGLENVLAAELSELNARNIIPANRSVFFEGNLEMIYKTNYLCRTALRILKEINYFKFKNVDQFYLKCKNVNWSDFISLEQNFVVRSTVINSDEFRNSMFASLKVKDAVADYFRDRFNKRPDVNTENPDIIIDVHIYQDSCTLSLDSSGESLHKRGYRVKQGDAPLNEVLAAGMIKIAGWKGNSDFLDPMCGSGTLSIEAAMIAHNIPAAKFRKEFAFENWADFDRLLLDQVKQSVPKKEFNHKIYASDISGSNLLNAQTNARRALVFNKIVFQKSDFKELDIEITNGTIIINPPYGERLVEKNMAKLYATIGERLKHRYNGNTAWVLSSSIENINEIGLRPSQKLDLFNGALKCKYNKYQLFTGKRKELK